MAIVEIPLRSDLPDYQFNLPLDGTFYTFRFSWNTRMSNWFMDIGLLDGTNLLSGIPVFANYSLISRFKNPSLPQGELFFYDTSGEATDPTRNDLGERVKLFYDEVDDG